MTVDSESDGKRHWSAEFYDSGFSEDDIEELKKKIIGFGKVVRNYDAIEMILSRDDLYYRSMDIYECFIKLTSEYSCMLFNRGTLEALKKANKEITAKAVRDYLGQNY